MPQPRHWSQKVTETSNALDIKGGTFAKDDPAEIARGTQAGCRAIASPQIVAVSLRDVDADVFINRAGSGLSAGRKQKLEQAKVELRKQFGVEEAERKPRKPSAAKKPSTTKRTTLEAFA